MNSLALDPTQKREIVWKINTNPAMDKKKKKTSKNTTSTAVKEPVHVKELIEKTFHRLSAQLLDKVNQLEQELAQMKAENDELKSKLNLNLETTSL